MFGNAPQLDAARIAEKTIPEDIIEKINGGRALTAMYVLNFPSGVVPDISTPDPRRTRARRRLGGLRRFRRRLRRRGGSRSAGGRAVDQLLHRRASAKGLQFLRGAGADGTLRRGASAPSPARCIGAMSRLRSTSRHRLPTTPARRSPACCWPAHGRAISSRATASSAIPSRPCSRHRRPQRPRAPCSLLDRTTDCPSSHWRTGDWKCYARLRENLGRQMPSATLAAETASRNHSVLFSAP